MSNTLPVTSTPQTQLIYADLTYKIRGAIFEVFNQIGFGHKEEIYQKALGIELTERGIPFEREKSLPVSFKNTKVGIYRPDFIVADKIILELKSLNSIPQALESQILHYLKTTDYKLGLLVNFGSSKLFIKRLVWTRQGLDQTESADIRKEIRENL
ncbi:MAG: hypothetical protein ACD_37C00405G0002 [uncultured bacterium]|nr:MAG: hypothetical protein ACD_37C00405G0002 [uncultured bacterium]